MMRLDQLLKFSLLALVAGLGIYYSFGFFHRPQASGEGVSQAMVFEPPGPVQYELRVLFIGNSYTFYNNLPQMLGRIAESDKENQTRFVIQSVTRGGIGLSELWDSGEARTLLQQNKWNYVVLQEQSFWAMFTDSVRIASRVVRAFDGEIKQAGARTLLFTTWPRQPGSQWYENPKTSFLRSPEYMLRRFNDNTQNLADNIGATVIPVGNFWLHTMAQRQDIALYGPDGSHPSPAGTYLSALVFYRYFSGHNPAQVGYAPSGVSDEQAAALRGIASW